MTAPIENNELRVALLKFDLARAKTGRRYISGEINDEQADIELEESLATVTSVINAHTTRKETEARLEGEQYGRANEHHIISGLMTRTDLQNLDSGTIRRLKERQAEIQTLNQPKPTKESV